jgi:predicted metal-dependent hydrolase
MTERGQVQFGASVIDYRVLRSRRRRKTVEITIDPAAGVLVAAPAVTTGEDIRAIIARRAAWIVRHVTEEDLRPRPRRFVSGESLPYLGRQVRIQVTAAPVRRVTVRFTHWSFQIVEPEGLDEHKRRRAIERAIVQWYQARASERLRERVRCWAAVAGYSSPPVFIRSQRQRWGSCSADGTLRFNWRIVMAPPALIDYVMVHELAHLRVRNHSAEFWAILQRLMPDYERRRARLREVGPSLAL